MPTEKYWWELMMEITPYKQMLFNKSDAIKHNIHSQVS